MASGVQDKRGPKNVFEILLLLPRAATIPPVVEVRSSQFEAMGVGVGRWVFFGIHRCSLHAATIPFRDSSSGDAH